MNSVDSYNKLLETEFQRIDRVMDSSAVEIALLNAEIFYNESSAQKKAEIVFDVEKQLSNLQKTSHYIKDTRVYLPILDQIISFNMSSAGIMDNLEFKALKQNKSNRFFYFWDNKLLMYVPYINQSGIVNNPKGLFILSVELNNDSIKSVLDNIVGYKSGGSVFFASDRSWIISSRKEPDIISILPDVQQQGKNAELMNTMKEYTGNIGIKLEVYHYLSSTFLSYLNRWNMLREISGRMDMSCLVCFDESTPWQVYNDFFSKLAHILFELRITNQGEQTNRLVAELQAYISGHLHKDLTLSQLGNVVHLNPSYLSYKKQHYKK
jgi:hypothetical protein